MIVPLISFLILIYSVILHEVSHGWVADRLGDPTARLSGRLTLDPRPHIDPLMTIALPLLLLITRAGIIFGAAKPVPIDPFNFREPKKDTAIVALSGPVTNLLIAVFLALIYRIGSLIILNETLFVSVRAIATQGIIINVSLAFFNLFPLPPLDGFKVLAGLLPDRLSADLYRFERFGFSIIFLVLLLAPALIFDIISPLITSVIHLLLG